jgi:hypothetical protein
MTVTLVGDVSDQVQKSWSPLFTDELREVALLPNLVNRNYQGQIVRGGDTVYVSQINAPQGELRTVGTDADTFSTEKLDTDRVAIVANKRAQAAFEFEDLAYIQSQIGEKDSEVRKALVYAAARQVNKYLYSILSPSAAAPDHILSGITAMDASQVLAIRLLSAQAKWMQDKPWYLLMDPSYYNDVLSAQTFTSSDYVGPDQPAISGQIVRQRFGFSMLEDNSLSVDQGLAFHPDFMHLVMQQEPTFQVSSQHPNKRHGFIISVDMIFGAALSNAGDKKHVKIYNTDDTFGSL